MVALVSRQLAVVGNSASYSSILYFGLLVCSFFFVHSPLSLFFFLFPSVLLSLLSSLAAFFFFLRSPFLCFLFLTFPLSLFFFSSPLFGSSSGFYSQRMQAFFGNGWRASQWRGMSVARHAS
jgi:hypothetical protein